jgi:hypothetical protein
MERVFGVVDVDEGRLEISLGGLHTDEQVACELLIDSDAVTPRRRAIDIVEKLLESGDLRRLEGLDPSPVCAFKTPNAAARTVAAGVHITPNPG